MISLILATTLLAMPVCADSRDKADTELQKMLSGRSPGAPVSCIDLGFVSNVTVVEGKGIVYNVAGRLFLNVPEDPSRIRRDDILVTESVGSRLCEHDAVRLLDWSSRIPHGYATLGKFVPYSKPMKIR
ncbi:MAG: hypothetical protein ACRYG4_14880 [Janthinobacterium lividum]